MTAEEIEGTPAPLLRVVRGQPTPEELAALTVVVAALAQQQRPRRRPTPVGAWASRTEAVRTPLRHGPGGWLAAARH
ncbi:acyl-CoA carboxylase subunit epsilon [Modestobacter excelsi]|uniref:acyl-CoA carboxylase subunit epsilon n=1 Tax=Modestobacter excelsi TaxID=2213161 RepID=UPI001FEA88F1|nr:acyl-CoA carboxylase subunit epsilon [Modestobacter excelsi]